MTIRVLDFGDVSPIASQAIYHGIADALGAEDAPVVTLCSPTDPYICVGALQDVRLEVDEAYCRSRGLPVLRREIGGGAVYLDRNQLFYHFIFPRHRAPAASLDLFPWFIEPVLRTYRSLGIAAQYRPINDIHVDGRKIGGTAAAWIGEATVLGGSFLFDFDGATMARCLKVPSEKFRDKLATTLADYITSMAKLLPAVPPRPLVKQRYLDAVAEWLGEELAESNPTPAERAAIAARETEHGRSRVRLPVRPAPHRLGRQGRRRHPSHRGRVEGAGRPDPGGSARTRRHHRRSRHQRRLHLSAGERLGRPRDTAARRARGGSPAVTDHSPRHRRPRPRPAGRRTRRPRPRHRRQPAVEP